MNKQYYSNVVIINNLLNAMRFRENAFINVTNTFKYNARCVVVKETTHILKNMMRFYFHERDYNIYSSVARFDFAKLSRDKEFPPFSFNLMKRKQQMTEFNIKHEGYRMAYDFVLDFDVKESHNETYKQVSIIKNQFDVFKVPYILRFSGSGFHVIVPSKYLPVSYDKLNIISKLKNTAIQLKTIYNLSCLDTGIYDGRRVIKTAYSIDNKTGLVCLPLTDFEFEHFTPKFCRPESVLALPDLYQRNAVLRNGDPDGLANLIKRRLNDGD